MHKPLKLLILQAIRDFNKIKFSRI